MKPIKYYISDILKSLCSKIESLGICDSVYAEHRPTGHGEQSDRMVVISIPTGIEDNSAYQKARVNFHIIVRDRDGGVSATDKLQEMLDGVVGIIPVTEKRYTLTNPNLIFKGSDELGFTVWVLSASLVINTTDRLIYGGE